MRLTEKEYQELLRLYHSMMLWAGKKKGIVAKDVVLAKFKDATDFNKFACRQEIYTIPNFHNEYIKENPDNFDKNELEIIEGFKNYLKGRFYILKHLKEHSIFIKDDIAYGVLAQKEPFSIVAGEAMVMAEAVLLPYRGQIVYDGMLQIYNIGLGSGYRSSLTEVLNESKAKYGIVKSLPFNKEPAYSKLGAEEQLLFFMKDKNNREYYDDEITKLIVKNPSLLVLFKQEWGRVHAVKIKKYYKDLGLNKAYFAILEGVVVASAVKQEDLTKQLKNLVPKEKLGWAYIFKL